MDLAMFMNLVIYILALFGLILVLFMFVKFVLWCLMCDTDPLNDVERAKLQFQLNRIDQSKAKKSSKKVQSQSYRKASEPFPEIALRRSPEIEGLNSENLSIHSVVIEESDSVKEYSAVESDEEILIIDEIEKVIREAESPPVHYAEIDHVSCISCITRNDSSLSGCVCPFCSKSGRATAELVRASVEQQQQPEEDQVSIQVESECSYEEQENESDEIAAQKAEAAKKEENNKEIKNVFQELDSALEEIDGFVVEMINEGLVNGTGTTEDGHQQKEAIVSEVEPEVENKIFESEQIANDNEDPDKSEPSESKAELEVENTEDNAGEDKPKVPEKPKVFMRQASSKNQPQCVTYSQVVDQLKKRNSHLLSTSEAVTS